MRRRQLRVEGVHAHLNRVNALCSKGVKHRAIGAVRLRCAPVDKLLTAIEVRDDRAIRLRSFAVTISLVEYLARTIEECRLLLVGPRPWHLTPHSSFGLPFYRDYIYVFSSAVSNVKKIKCATQTKTNAG